MNQVWYIGIGLAAGVLMGYVYFRGLWWTVCYMTEYGSKNWNPYGLAVLSFFVRSALAVGGFYLLLVLGWEAMALGLIGFVAVRVIVVRRWALHPPAITAEPEGEEWS